MNKELPAWTRRMVTLSLLLFFFALPHTLEDFASHTTETV